MSQTGIVILGMHRSGTSVTADLVRCWGAHTPEDDLLPPSPTNPNGYWELQSLRAFNERLLATVQSRWYLPPTARQQQRLRVLADDSVFRSGALDLLQSVAACEGPWFIKDPRLTILLPFWQQVWTNVVYVIPIRHPIEVAESLRRRNHMPLGLGMLLWERYAEALLRQAESRRCLFLDHQALFASPAETVARLHGWLETVTGLGRSDIRRNDAARVIDARLRHCVATPQLSMEYMTERQRYLYDVLISYANGSAAFERRTEEDAPERPWRDLLMMFELLVLFMTRSDAAVQRELLPLVTDEHREAFGLAEGALV